MKELQQAKNLEAVEVSASIHECVLFHRNSPSLGGGKEQLPEGVCLTMKKGLNEY